MAFPCDGKFNNTVTGCWADISFHQNKVNFRWCIINEFMHFYLKCVIFTLHNCATLNYIEWVNYGVMDTILMQFEFMYGEDIVY